jgi:hypothetical protein
VTSTCQVGFKIGKDYTCSECDNDYTNQTDKSTTLGTDVISSSTPVTKNGQKVCFPKTCPNGSALGTDYTCSACPRGQEGSVATGCEVPSSDITIIRTENMVIGNIKVNAAYTEVDVEYFLLDITLKVSNINIGFVKVSIGSDSQTTSSDGEMTFSSVKLTTDGIPVTIEYYATKADANAKKNMVSSERKKISLSQKLTPANQTSISCTNHEFAAAYLIMPAGGQGSPAFIAGEVTGGDQPQPQSDCVDCHGGICGVGILVSMNNRFKGCPFGSKAANTASCRC